MKFKKIKSVFQTVSVYMQVIHSACTIYAEGYYIPLSFKDDAYGQSPAGVRFPYRIEYHLALSARTHVCTSSAFT